VKSETPNVKDRISLFTFHVWRKSIRNTKVKRSVARDFSSRL